MHGFAPSEVLLLEDHLAQTCWTAAPEKHIKMLDRSTSSLSSSLKKAAKGGFEIEVKHGVIHSCFPEKVSYCSSILKIEGVAAIWHGDTRRQSCVRCHSTYEDRVWGGNSSSRVVTEITDTTRKEREMQKETASLEGNGVEQEGERYKAS